MMSPLSWLNNDDCEFRGFLAALVTPRLANAVACATKKPLRGDNLKILTAIYLVLLFGVL